MTNGTKIKVLRYVESDKVVVFKVPQSAQKHVKMWIFRVQKHKLWRAVCVWLL